MISDDYSYLAPDILEMFDECFERSGVDMKSVGNDHLESALRSLKLMTNSEWLTLGWRTWMFQLLSFTTTTGADSQQLPVGVLTVSDAVLLRDARATAMNVMSRNEFLEIPDKTETGKPDRYFIDRQYNLVNMTMWRTPENDTDQIQYWAFMNMAKPGSDASQQLQMPPHMLEAAHAGLAARLAMKFNPQRYAALQSYYRGPQADANPRAIGGVLALALDADRPFGDVTITPLRGKR